MPEAEVEPRIRLLLNKTEASALHTCLNNLTIEGGEKEQTQEIIAQIRTVLHKALSHIEKL